MTAVKGIGYKPSEEQLAAQKARREAQQAEKAANKFKSGGKTIFNKKTGLYESITITPENVAAKQTRRAAQQAEKAAKEASRYGGKTVLDKTTGEYIAKTAKEVKAESLAKKSGGIFSKIGNFIKDGAGKIGKFFKGKGGKIALIGTAIAALTAGGIWLYNKLSGNKSEEATSETTTTTTPVVVPADTTETDDKTKTDKTEEVTAPDNKTKTDETEEVANPDKETKTDETPVPAVVPHEDKADEADKVDEVTDSKEDKSEVKPADKADETVKPEEPKSTVEPEKEPVHADVKNEHTVKKGEGVNSIVRDALKEQGIDVDKLTPEELKQALKDFVEMNKDIVKIYKGKRKEWHGNKFFYPDDVVKVPDYSKLKEGKQEAKVEEPKAEEKTEIWINRQPGIGTGSHNAATAPMSEVVKDVKSKLEQKGIALTSEQEEAMAQCKNDQELAEYLDSIGIKLGIAC